MTGGEYLLWVFKIWSDVFCFYRYVF
jgi:hypothetical protein